MMRYLSFCLLAIILFSCKTEEKNSVFAPKPGEEAVYPYFHIPVVDISADIRKQVVVDREQGQYLGHPTTCLLDDGRTILCVYPKGHGRGEIIYKMSSDGGVSWSERLKVPDSWATSKEVPVLYQTEDSLGKKRIIMFSGLYPARMALSENNGNSWSELDTLGCWGGIVVTGALTPVMTGKGHYISLFHDDTRFFTEDGYERYRVGRQDNVPALFTLYSIFSYDGGITWSFPEAIYSSREMHLCEPGIVRSPDGNKLAVLLRENRRVANSQVIFSEDEGRTWSDPVSLPNALTGDRHVPVYLPDGRLLIIFRDVSVSAYHQGIVREANEGGETDYSLLAEKRGEGSPTEGDWVAWVGRFEDIEGRSEGAYRIRLMDNMYGWDTAYPGVEVLDDGTVVTTTYGHWERGEEPYIVSVRFNLSETDALITSSLADGER